MADPKLDNYQLDRLYERMTGTPVDWSRGSARRIDLRNLRAHQVFDPEHLKTLQANLARSSND